MVCQLLTDRLGKDEEDKEEGGRQGGNIPEINLDAVLENPGFFDAESAFPN